jgi:hypothetical protein
MMDQTKQSAARAAFSIAGVCALAFGALFFVYLVSTILLVGGDGTAPRVTHLSGAIMQFSTRALDAPDESGVVAAVLLWSSVVFATAFIGALLFRAAVSATDDFNRGYAGYAFLAALSLGLLNIQQDRTQGADRHKEEELVLDLVRNNPLVIQKVGVIDLIHVGMTTETKGRVDRYQIDVRGKRDEKFNDLVAVVDVSRGSGKPNYIFRCINPDMAYVSASENPCKGNAK